jgi:O-antigen/teichoic acid export membrane protein
LFGAEDYGRFAFILSLSYLMQILGDFGTFDIMGRFVPSMSDTEASRLYMQTLAFKVVVGLGCGLATVGAALLLTPWMRWDWAILISIGVALHVVAWVPFHFSLGRGRVGLWMSEQAWRQWALLGLLLVLLPIWNLTGAIVAVVLMEVIFCGLGIWSIRADWRATEIRLDWTYLRPYVRFGASFFLANLAGVALFRSGPVLIETITRQSTEAGYFNLALGLFLMAYITLGQFSQSLIPDLSRFRAEGRPEAVRSWLNNFVRYGWGIGWLGAILVWAVGDWATPLVFGADFAPATAALKWISLGMPFAALLAAANVLATVIGRGRARMAASIAALVVFAGGVVWLAPNYGAAGAAGAMSLAVGSCRSSVLRSAVRRAPRESVSR